MQAACERQHESQDMGADVVVVDLPEIGDRQRMVDQFRIVVAGRRRGLRRLQPAQALRFRQKLRRQRAERGIGGDDRGRGFVGVLGDDQLHARDSIGQPLGPLAGQYGLWRQHQERKGVGVGHRRPQEFVGQHTTGVRAATGRQT